jgi:nucleoside-diphosphate-sugar epimerase
VKALITGGAGFIGLHLARRALAEGWSVDLVDNFSRGKDDADLADVSAKGARLHKVDLSDPAALAALPSDYGVIFHLAARLGVANVLREPYAVLRDNAATTLSVLEFCRKQRSLARLVFTSTSEVYAGTLRHFTLPFPTPESAPLAIPDVKESRTAYMLSKIYGEALCAQSGLPHAIVRPHNVYGPRMGLSHVIPELMKKAHDAAPGARVPVFSVSHKRTFCYVEDAVETLLRVSTAPAGAGATINVGVSSPEVAIGDLARMIFGVVGKKLVVDEQPETQGSPTRRCPDIAEAVRVTGYAPRVSLEEGLRRTYTWYKDNVFIPTGDING